MADVFFTRAPSTIVTIPLTGQLEFTIPFEFLARKFVVVTLLGTDRKVLTLGTDYRFVAVNKIQLSRQPDGNYTMVELRRFTSATDRLVSFVDGSILRATDLNLAQVQTMHVAEEARDMTSENIGVNDDGNLDARTRKIVNLANGTDQFDAVNLGQLRQFDSSTGSNADKAAKSAAEAKESELNAAGSEARCVIAEAKAISSAGTAMTAASDANRSSVKAEAAKVSAESSAARAEGAAAPATEIYNRLNHLELINSSGFINPDDIDLPTPVSDWARIQAAVDKWTTNKSKQILLGRDYDVTGDSIRVANIETENPESQLVFIGGELKKNNAGFMFDKPLTGQTQSTGGIVFIGTRFVGNPANSTYILNGHHDFLGNYGSTHILRTTFIGCMGLGIRVVYSETFGYIQSIHMSNCVWRKWSGYMIDCGFLYDVDISAPRYEAGDAVIRTRKSDADPAANSLKVRGGVIEGNSGASGRQINVGVCFGTEISGVYQEANAGGDYAFNSGSGYHKGLSITGCGFQPTTAQLADANYYPILLGKGADSGIHVAANTSTGNLYEVSSGNEASLSPNGSWAAKRMFGPTASRFLSTYGTGMKGQVYSGAGFEIDYATGTLSLDVPSVGRGSMSWSNSVPSPTFGTIGSIMWKSIPTVEARQYGAGVVHDALIIGWVKTQTGWREIPIMLPY